MSKLDLQVLAIDEVYTGKSAQGRVYNRLQLQVFDGRVAGNISLYDDDVEKLKKYKPGYYAAELGLRAGQRGSIDISIIELTPVRPATATS